MLKAMIVGAGAISDSHIEGYRALADRVRIVAVVDAYDAITSERPYQEALAKQSAVLELKLNAGTQFDPRVVRAFMSVIGEDDLA